MLALIITITAVAKIFRRPIKWLYRTLFGEPISDWTHSTIVNAVSPMVEGLRVENSAQHALGQLNRVADMERIDKRHTASELDRHEQSRAIIERLSDFEERDMAAHAEMGREIAGTKLEILAVRQHIETMTSIILSTTPPKEV